MSLFNIHRKPIEVVNEAPKTTGKKGRMSDTVNKAPVDRIAMQMDILRQAVEMARNIYSPWWIDLYNIYRNSMTDAQVRRKYLTAINKLIASTFVVSKDGKDSDELSAMFKRPWFDHFLQFCYDADLWGYTLVEFGQQDANGEFIDCKLFPRLNVYPFNRNIITNYHETVGFDYSKNPAQYFLLELSDPDDIGLLELISREVIWKAFARRDWSEHSEKFGKPHLVIMTDSDDPAELNKMEDSARNFACNGYFIGDRTQDEIKYLESSARGNAHLIYENNIRLIDEQISKLMNGQTSTADTKAFVGAAQVHERLLDDWHSSRLRRFSNIINYELIPFLIYHGYPLDGATGRFTDLDADETDQTPDEPIIPGEAQNRFGKKKALVSPWQ